MSFQRAFNRRAQQTPESKKKEVDPSRRIDADNPLPDSVYDEKGNFLGFKPKSMGRPAHTGGSSAGAGGGHLSDRTPPAAKIPDWRARRPKTLGGRIWEDVKETYYDIQEEPEEVPFRIKERAKEYFRPKRGLQNVTPKRR